MDTALWVAIITSALAGIGWLFKNEKEKRHEIEKQLSEKKYGVYIEIIEIFASIVNSIRLQTPVNTDAMAEKMLSISKEIIIYGSDAVLKNFSYYRQNARPDDPLGALRMYYNIMIEIRKDMGYPKTIANQDELLGVFISDYKQVRDELLK